MRPARPEGLSAEELAALQSLGAELRSALVRARRLAERLPPAWRRSVRAEVRDRLLCVIQDSLAPAVRDLESIESTATTEERQMSPSQEVRGEVERMREALRAEIGRRNPSSAEVERQVGLPAGGLDALLAGEVELGVAHLFRILHALGVPPSRFFVKLYLRSAEGTQGGAPHAA